MPAKPQFYASDDATAVALSFSIDGGTASAATEIRIWNDKGGVDPATTPAKNVRMLLEASTNGVDFKTSGLPPVDQSWGRLEIFAKNSAGDSTMEDQVTGELPIGGTNEVTLKDIPKNCARHVRFKIVVPSSVTESSYTIRLTLVTDDTSISLSAKVTILAGGGVLLAWMNPTTRRLTKGGAITVAGTATISLARRKYAYDGKHYARLNESYVANNLDSAGAALASGELYWIRVSQPQTGAAVFTKGTKGAAAVPPALPAGHIYLGDVRIDYQAGGVPVINTDDVDQTTVYRGEYLCEPGAATQSAYVHPGEALAVTDKHAFNTGRQQVNLSVSATNRVWLLSDGTLSVTTTATAPQIDALLLWEFVTDATGAVTSHTDKRSFVGRAIDSDIVLIEWPGEITSDVTDAGFGLLKFKGYLERVCVIVGSMGAGATGGSIKVDVLSRAKGVPTSTAGTTIFTSSATDDQRPSIAHNAASLYAESDYHEVIEFDEFTRFTFSIVAASWLTGVLTANPSDLYVALKFRKAA